MSINKRKLLLPAVAAVSFAINILLLQAHCNRSKNNKPSTVADRAEETGRQDRRRAQPVPPKQHNQPSTPACEDDEDCPGEDLCEDNKCMTLEDIEKEWIDAGADALDKKPNPSGPRTCTYAADCGCGYECKYDECHKLQSSCNVNGDCNAGDFCNREYDQVCGTCTKSECENDTDCGNTCTNHCYNNRCVEYGCCNDSDCSIDQFCYKSDNQAEGNCRPADCRVDNDCGCGFICDQDNRICLERSSDRPIQCCGGYFYYQPYSSCVPQYLKENGRCLDNSHCPRGKVCNTDEDICYPESCVENADCGCNAVCRRGHCESGCDDNSGCCDEDYPVCDRGECVSRDEDEE